MSRYKNILYLSIFYLVLFTNRSNADNFNYNTFNNHGILGLINLPSARFYDEGSFGITLYDGTPDQKMTMTSFPYDWLEASFFYMNIQGEPYPGYEYQDLKDKGFNFKIRLKEEGILPALAIGINDIAGTGYFSSEFIVGSYGIGNIDMHFGLGWGTLNGSDHSFKNPLTYLHDNFNNRSSDYDQLGGKFNPSQYFSNKEVSPFYGISYAFNERLIFKLENDTTEISGKIDYEIPSDKITFGFDYHLTNNFTVGISNERNTHLSIRISYKKNTLATTKPYKYKKSIKNPDDDKYTYFIKNLESNGIGVNKIVESAENIGIELTQFTHPSIDIIEEILYSAKKDSGLEKNIKADYRIADLSAYTDDIYDANSKLIYERQSLRSFSTNTKFNIRPYLASREGFLKAAILIENNSEYILKDNLFFTSNLKYSIKDNFSDLTIPPDVANPAQVRSDVKEYLRNFNQRLIVGRAQFDYHVTPKKNNHVMVTAGIMEEMFSGIGFEYLYFEKNKNYALGFELFKVKKRDYDLRFGTLDYETETGFINLYYRNYDLIPFDGKISYGKYLAGDVGTTFEISRSYRNGVKFGIFASFTDVSQEDFGEGSFDKGIFFNIPIYKNFINYSWRPLTKDPGAKLNRKHTLHDLLIKFKPYNE